MIAAPRGQVFAAHRQVRPLGSLEVRVVDRNRNPVDAIVIVRGGSGWAGRTNAMGYYSVSVPPGKYLVSASYRGHSAARQVRVDAGRAKRIKIAFRFAGSSTPPAASSGANRSGQPSAVSAVPPNGASTTGSTQGGPAQRPAPSSKPAPGMTAGTTPTPAPGVTTGTTQTPTPEPESAPAPAPTPAPANPTPAKPAKLKALTADPPVTEPGGTSRITAEVVNPDSVPLTFSWIASGGSISGAEAQALWVAPQSTGEFTISVVVKDSKGRKTSGSIVVYVQGSSSKPAPTPTPAPAPPQITALIADPSVTPPGGTSSITAEVANPDNVALTFSWAASGGSINGSEAQALWAAPQSTGEFTISLVVQDNQGRTASGSIAVSVKASSSSQPPSLTTEKIPRLALMSFYEKFTDDFRAKTFDIIRFHAYGSAPHEATPQRVAYLKSVNPNVKVMLYYHIWGQWDWQSDWSIINAHEDWFVHDIYGKRVKSGESTVAAWLMNLGNAEYRAYVRQRVLGLITRYGFDGLWEDGPITTVRNPFAQWSGPLPDSVKQAWHGWAITHLKEMRQALGSRLYITNTTPWAADYSIPDWMDTDFLPYVDGTTMEGFAHAYWQSASQMINESWWDWQRSVVKRNLDAGKIIHLMSGVNSWAESEQSRWENFTLVSYLLWADGSLAYYNWHSYPHGYFAKMSTQLGRALGPAFKDVSGVWQRDFERGRVRLNPSSVQSRGELAPMTATIVVY